MLQEVFLAGCPPSKKSHWRHSLSMGALPPVHCWPLHQVQSTSRAHKRLEEHARRVCVALAGPKSSKLGQMQECKLKVCGWEFSASTTVLAEKHVGGKIRRLTPEELRAWMWPP